MSFSPLRRAVAALAAACALPLASGAALAADDAFPSRPIRLLVGFAAGGSSDTVARIMAPVLSKNLKQNIIIDNRPGAGGNIASDALVKAAPDGYTIMLGTIGSLAVNQHLSKLTYDPVKDMEPISLAVSFSNVLVVNANSKIKTFADYVKAASAQHSDMSFGSSGIGSSGHLAGELLKSVAGLQNQHVAYRGGAPAMNDLLGGTLASIFASPTDAVQFIAAGKLRPIATTGLRRLDVLPDVPTIAESGYPGFEANNWYAFTAPAHTPKAVVDVLNKAIVATLKDPDVDAKLKKLGLDPAPTTPAETDRYIRAESKKWGDLVKKININAV
ncbi:Bug family tripartite tricarboxylate transporter substrate binding protein [Bordetella genomosp. 8]|uniref:Bug family tripartite tricarboxylate transporter substrate binding protein n=1 Tax=Bordetella genomosp. 8 TaxID=1416806 RepID=UPI0012FDF4C8|nr:tripartite tricarboxylate transporter substrate binding protein [Bordetella genomosp. 8]